MAERHKVNMVAVRLVKDAPVWSEKTITSPADAVEVMGDYLKQMDREVVCVINLKTNGTPISCHIASIGGINAALVESREIFKTAVLSNAASILVMHCHPSGSLIPSREDINITDKLIQAGAIMGIPVLDHIIVGAGTNGYFSFKSEDILPKPEVKFKTEYQQLKFQDVVLGEEKKVKKKTVKRQERD